MKGVRTSYRVRVLKPPGTPKINDLPVIITGIMIIKDKDVSKQQKLHNETKNGVTILTPIKSQNP